MQKKKMGAQIVESARSWIGTPYLHQASVKGVGCDCLGLVRGIWREIQGKEPVPTPTYSSAWAEVSNQDKLLEAANRFFIPRKTLGFHDGDVLLFRMKASSVAKHLGIASSPASFIHAYDRNAVVESALSEFWRRKIVGVFQFPNAVHEDNI